MTRTTPSPAPRRAFRPGALAIGGCASLAVLLALFLLRDPSPSAASSPSPSASPAPTLGAASNAAPRRAPSLLSPAERNRALDQLEENFRTDPAAYEKLVAEAALELAGHSPAEAFFFLSRFHGSAPITQAKRGIVLDWSGAGLDGVTAALRQQVAEHRGGGDDLMPFLVSIYQDERAAGFADFLAWMNTFSAPADREIQVSAANSFLRLCQPAQRPAMARLYAKQPDMQPWASALLVQHAGASPAEALELVAHADFAALAAPLVGDVLRAVAETSPETASRIVQAEYLEELAADHAQATGRELPAVRDELLSGLLNGLLISSPSSAWELAGRLSEDAARQKMLGRIQSLVTAQR